MGERTKREITVYLHHETSSAWMVGEDPSRNKNPVWLPKSQCDEAGPRKTHTRESDGFIIGTTITLAVPEWLLGKTGLEGLV